MTYDLFGSVMYMSGPTDFVNFINKQEPIRVVIVDAETNQRLTFSPNKMMKINTDPISYSWKIYYDRYPNSVLEYVITVTVYGSSVCPNYNYVTSSKGLEIYISSDFRIRFTEMSPAGEIIGHTSCIQSAFASNCEPTNKPEKSKVKNHW